VVGSADGSGSVVFRQESTGAGSAPSRSRGTPSKSLGFPVWSGRSFTLAVAAMRASNARARRLPPLVRSGAAIEASAGAATLNRLVDQGIDLGAQSSGIDRAPSAPLGDELAPAERPSRQRAQVSHRCSG